MKKLKILSAILCGIMATASISFPAYAAEKAATAAEKNEPLPAPTLKIKKVDKEEISLSWNEVDGAIKYQIYYSTEKESGYEKAGTVKKTSATVQKLEQGTDYYFKIRAISENGAKGKYSKVKTATTKGYPSVSLYTSNFKIYVSNIYQVGTLDDEFNEYYQDTVVALGVIITNISDEDQYFFPDTYCDIYGPDGSELYNPYLYFDDDFTSYVKIKPGEKVTSFIFFPYQGDGEYIFSTNDYENEQECFLLIEKDEAATQTSASATTETPASTTTKTPSPTTQKTPVSTTPKATTSAKTSGGTTSSTSNTSTNKTTGKSHFYDYYTPEQQNTTRCVLNTSTKKYHKPTCSEVKKIKPSNYSTIDSESSAIRLGYVACKRCH